MTIIIAGFPGTGKTIATGHLRAKGFSVSDSDSSQFSWIDVQVGSTDGENIGFTRERNPNFVEDYLSHINQRIDEGFDVIFISTHEETLHELRKNQDLVGMFYIVTPSKGSRDEYLLRYMKRGSNANFIELMMKNFDKFVDSILHPAGSPYDAGYGRRKYGSAEVITLGEGKFIYDLFSTFPKAPSFGFDGSVEGWGALYNFVTKDATDIGRVFELAHNPSNAIDLLDEYKIVFDEYGEKHRWAIERTIVYEREDGKCLEKSYMEGSTESQEDYGYAFREVKRRERTVTVVEYV